MASKYWIKLYHELLHDPKMGRLPDRLWRRAIELFLLAGENEDNGYLPSIPDMAWTLRIPEAELETDLQALAADGLNILACVDGRWLVVKFAKRQAPVETTERVQRFRERQRKEEYAGNDNETKSEPERNDGVTKRSIDTESDKELDSPTGATPSAPAKTKTKLPRVETETSKEAKAMFLALAAACKINWRICTNEQRAALNQSEKRLRDIGATPDDIGKFAAYWNAQDWRGKQGDAPEPHQVREEWGRFEEWRGSNGKSPTPQLEVAAEKPDWMKD